MVEPTDGAADPRTPQALMEAQSAAAAFGVPLEVRHQASPVEHVIHGPYALAVHPVLDAPDGHALLHPSELPKSSVDSGNPAAVVRLLEEFDGDVVAVFDGVRLLGVESHLGAQAVTVSVLVGIFAAAGVGLLSAPAASASVVDDTTSSLGGPGSGSGPDGAAIASADAGGQPPVVRGDDVDTGRWRPAWKRHRAA